MKRFDVQQSNNGNEREYTSGRDGRYKAYLNAVDKDREVRLEIHAKVLSRSRETSAALRPNSPLRGLFSLCMALLPR